VTNVREVLSQGQAKLSLGPHPERARQDAEFLLRHLLGQGHAWMISNLDADIPKPIRDSYGELLQRRCDGEPIQYIFGETEFYGLPFSVAPGVLIPRPETEHLVEKVLELAAQLPRTGLQIADIGTGSGAIAVALAHSLPEARVFATDLSPQALSIAESNARRNSVASRIAFLEGDLLSPLAGRQFQIIASNPPYIPLADRDSLSVEVREFEPHAALFAGDDGLETYRRLIPQAFPLLVPGGWLALEIGYGQQPAIVSMLELTGYRELQFLPDYQGIPRVACGKKG
jgi:release factor glutamine methyltransferase